MLSHLICIIALPATCWSIFDNTLKHFIMREDILKGMQKPWMAYIEQLLINKFYENNNYEVVITIKSLLTQTNILIQQNNDVTIHKDEEWPYKDESLTVTMPVGQTHYFVAPQNKRVYWRFFLDFELGLNITFSKFYMPEKLRDCVATKVSIVHMQDKPKLLLYCGTLPSFSHYTDFPYVFIFARSNVYEVPGEFFYFYSVMSNKIISTNSVENNETTSLQIVSIRSLNILLYTFYSSVPKYQKVYLQFKISEIKDVVLIDGPDIRGEKIKISKIKTAMHLSTFQFVLQIYNNKMYQNIIADTIAYYGTTKVTCNITVSQDISSKIAFPDYKCKFFNAIHCILYITAPHGMHLNITIINMMYNGFSNYYCKYGGLTFYEDNIHLLDTCENYGDKTARPSRNIYIPRKNILIAIYSYTMHSLITGKLKVGTTNCKAIRLNVCDLKQACALNTERCQQLLSVITKGTHFDFTHNPLEQLAVKTFLVSVKQNECGVIQMAADFSENGGSVNGSCYVSFKPLISDEKRSLDVVLQGFIYPHGVTIDQVGVPDILNAVYFYRNLSDVNQCSKDLASFSLSSCYYKYLFENCNKFISLHQCKLLAKATPLSFYMSYTSLSPALDNQVKICIYLYYNYINMSVDILFNNKQQNVGENFIRDLNPANVGNSLSPEQSLIFQIRNIGSCSVNSTIERVTVGMHADVQVRNEARVYKNVRYTPLFIEFKKSYKADIYLSCLSPKIYLSVPGTISKKDISLDSSDTNIAAFWHQTVAQKYMHHSFCLTAGISFKNSSPCYNTKTYQTSFGNGTALVFNLSSATFYFRFRSEKWWFSTMQNITYHKTQKFSSFFKSRETVSYNRKYYHSWTSADKLCHNIGGHLPVFYSRRDTEEFVSLLKLRYDLPLLEAIFIGLKLNVQNKNFKWVTDGPVSYQAWLNMNYGNRASQFTTKSIFSYTYFPEKDIIPGQKWMKTSFVPEIFTLLSNDRKFIKKNFLPIVSVVKQCSLMMLSNLAYPEWININCEEKKLIDIVCQLKENLTDDMMPSFPKSNNSYCIKEELLLKSLCYSFIWFDRNTSEEKLKISLNSFIYTSTEELKPFLLSTAATFPPLLLLSKNKQDTVQHVVYDRIYSQIYFHKQNQSLQKSHGLLILKHTSSRNYSNLINNTFQCISGEFISSFFVCDGISHCGFHDRSDENDCYCTNDTQFKNTCKFFCDSSKSCKCSPLFYYSHSGKCQSYIQDSSSYHKVIKADVGMITITNQRLINTSVNVSFYNCSMNDLVSDCGNSTEDEHILKDVLVNHTHYNCPEPHQIPCRVGHNSCFNITEICIFRINLHNHLIPCRTGGHLEDCTEFECNMKHKCPGYYCIPFAYICDGKWDCPDGSDEKAENRCGKNRLCEQMFHCILSQICSHIEDVCDGYFDCPLLDDELICDLKFVNCPKGCVCHVHAVFCLNGLPKQDNSLRFPYIFISISMEKSPVGFLHQFPKCIFMHLKYNSIEHICNMFSKNVKVISLDVGYNKISALTELCFQHAINLRMINLEHNIIDSIHKKTFIKLIHLKKVNLDNNYLQYISNLVFENLTVSHLSIKYNPLLNLQSNTFLHSKFLFVDSNDYRVCCITPSTTKCTAERPWYVSCSDLLPTKSMEIAFGVIPAIIFITNIVSLTLQNKLKKENEKAFVLITNAVNSNDIICLFSFTLLFIFHFVYKGTFVLHEAVWRESIPCMLIFGVSFLFATGSPFILIFMSVSRLMVVLHPITSEFKDRTFIKKWILLYIIVVIAISSLITQIYKFVFVRFPTSLCLPFIDPTNSIWFIKFITLLIFSIHLVSCVVISIIYIKLVKHLKDKEVTVRKSKTRSNTSLIVQLVIITSSNVLCWIPSDIIYVTSLFMSKYPIDMLIWTTLTATPINSVINPIVFIVSCIRKYCSENTKK